MRTAIMAAAALLALAEPAAATISAPPACKLRIEPGPTSWTIDGFDVFDTTPAQQTFDLVYANDGTANCAFVTDFSTEGEAYGLQGPAGDRTNYVLFDAFSNFDATPFNGATRLSVIRRQVTLAPGQQQLVRFRLDVDEAGIQHDGTYAQHLLVEADQTDGTMLAESNIVVGVQVIPSARLGLAGAFTLRGGQPVVDLGDLTAGPLQLPLRLNVESTRRYDVSFDSQDGGRLRLRGTDWTIPYSVTVGGTSVSLGGGGGTYSSSGPERLRHDSLPLGFVIGQTDTRRAGIYSDVLAITVAPQ